MSYEEECKTLKIASDTALLDKITVASKQFVIMHITKLVLAGTKTGLEDHALRTNMANVQKDIKQYRLKLDDLKDSVMKVYKAGLKGKREH